MENIIRKAVESGFMPERAIEFSGANNGILEKGGKPTMRGWSVWNMESGSSFCLNHSETVCDPIFWQSLGKVMEWGYEKGKYEKMYPAQSILRTFDENEGKKTYIYKGWLKHAITFHEINLTESWESAIKYLEDLLALPAVK